MVSVDLERPATGPVGVAPVDEEQRPTEDTREAAASQAQQNATHTTPTSPASLQREKTSMQSKGSAAAPVRRLGPKTAEVRLRSREDAASVAESSKATGAQPTAGSRTGRKLNAGATAVLKDGVDRSQQGRRTTRSQPGAQLQELPDRPSTVRRLGVFGKPPSGMSSGGAADDAAAELGKAPHVPAAAKGAPTAAVGHAVRAGSGAGRVASVAMPPARKQPPQKRPPAVLRVSRSSAGPAAAAKMHRAAAQEPGWKRKAAALSDGATAAATAQHGGKRQKPHKDAASAAKTFVRPPRFDGVSPPIGIRRADAKLTPWQAFEAPLRFRSLAAINEDASAQLPPRNGGCAGVSKGTPGSKAGGGLAKPPLAANGPAQVRSMLHASPTNAQTAKGQPCSHTPVAAAPQAAQAATAPAAAAAPAARTPAHVPKQPATTQVRLRAREAPPCCCEPALMNRKRGYRLIQSMTIAVPSSTIF